MSDEFFVDTCILVYAFDESEKQKREIAKKIIGKITKGEINGVISNQILGELFVALTQKIEKPIEKEKARIIINGLIDSVNWKKTNYSSQTVSKAVDFAIQHKTPFWDSLIIETMLENRIYKIFTENTKHFATEHIQVENPF